MVDDNKKLDSWNAPFDLNRDGKMSPEEKALRDYTIMNIFFNDDDDDDNSGGGGGGGGCLIPFTIMAGIGGSTIAGIIYGIARLVMHLKV